MVIHASRQAAAGNVTSLGKSCIKQLGAASQLLSKAAALLSPSSMFKNIAVPFSSSCSSSRLTSLLSSSSSSLRTTAPPGIFQSVSICRRNKTELSPVLGTRVTGPSKLPRVHNKSTSSAARIFPAQFLPSPSQLISQTKHSYATMSADTVGKTITCRLPSPGRLARTCPLRTLRLPLPRPARSESRSTTLVSATQMPTLFPARTPKVLSPLSLDTRVPVSSSRSARALPT